ncbi:HdeD family acid-resistance protein [Hansschlegelia sp. KR7-227]|jgi:uncharacterized membrane protein HdeD (DUF308 family)|uniref:HdeD family acid-resistance protein n=1 Tax=Hansschlegelia sp. KR7-227 TaxID=3400914 RepID=UPI003C0A14BD
MSDFAQKWGQSIALPFARSWGTIAMRGAFAVALGLAALFAPGAAMLSFVLLFAIYALADGAAELYLAARCARDGIGWRRWGPLLLGGLASLAAAAVALLWPGITVLVFILLMAFWSFVSGVMMVATAAFFGAAPGRLWLALAGAASIVFGAALAIAPLIGALVLTWWLGAYALAFGVALLVMAYRLRAHDRSPPAIGSA